MRVHMGGHYNISLLLFLLSNAVLVGHRTELNKTFPHVRKWATCENGRPIFQVPPPWSQNRLFLGVLHAERNGYWQMEIRLSTTKGWPSVVFSSVPACSHGGHQKKLHQTLLYTFGSESDLKMHSVKNVRVPAPKRWYCICWVVVLRWHISTNIRRTVRVIDKRK